MNIIIDQGNTNIKIYFFLNNKIVKKIIFPISNLDLSFIIKQKINKIIYSTVSGINHNILDFFSDKELLFFKNTTSLPITNKYKSETIGLDRLAAVVGATDIFPNTNILSIDIGSAVTYDFINDKNEFLGGNISPGLRLRFSSLNDYTKNLPLLEPKNIDFFLGKTTNQAIIAGIQNGLLFELEAYITKLSEDYKKIKIILSGGDLNLFAKKIKYSIFAEPNLVAIGLNKILCFNNSIGV